MDQVGSYGQFCPVAMAAEIVCTRWTALVLREMLCGGRRFNDLRKGLSRMSPTLLSKRLKELEEQGVVEQRKDARTGAGEYHLTQAGEELRPIIMSLGMWGQRWVHSELSLRNLDPTLLMWDMRRGIDAANLPDRRITILFSYPELDVNRRNYWLVIDRENGNEVCQVDPGNEVELFVTASLRSMTAVWMGHLKLSSEVEAGRITIEGTPAIARSMQQWFTLSAFAGEKPQRTARPTAYG
jgi:DNA-binding HxlR family transcriptional regulator